jgi:predicted TIM-barrel fold metal-dependent hydrolase
MARRPKSESLKYIYNVHTHVFTLAHVPDDFLGFGIVPLARIPFFAKIIDCLLKSIRLFTHNESFDRLAVFARAAEHKTSRDIFIHMKGYYPYGTKFCALAVDFEYMGAGKTLDYEVQLRDLAAIKNDQELGDFILPFIAIDPRRKNLLEIVRRYVEEYGFRGLKLYPPMGYYPDDPALHPVYAYAQENGLPLIAHCSPGGVYQKSRITGAIKKELLEKIGPIPWRERWKWWKVNEHLTAGYTHPDNYVPVLEKFPRLKVCLGHFGGAQEWDRYMDDSWKPGEEKPYDKSWLAVILDMMQKYPNLYADIAYTVEAERLLPMISVLVNNPLFRTRILYGSDCYMVQMDKSERAFSINVRGYLGEANFRQIAQDNPREFLAPAQDETHESTDEFE